MNQRRETQEEMRAEAIAGRMPRELGPEAEDDPPLFSPNHGFLCSECGRHEVWTAEKQRRWLRAPHGPRHSRAFRCRACREAHLAEPEQDA